MNFIQIMGAVSKIKGFQWVHERKYRRGNYVKLSLLKANIAYWEVHQISYQDRYRREASAIPCQPIACGFYKSGLLA